MTFEEILAKDGYLVYPNKGTSMRPLLREGKDLMVILARNDSPLKKYDAVLYKRADGAYVLHRILSIDHGKPVICGDHCWQPEYNISEAQIIGVLIAVVRNGKRKISVNNRVYQLYVHIWCDFFPVRATILHGKAVMRGGLSKLKHFIIH